MLVKIPYIIAVRVCGPKLTYLLQFPLELQAVEMYNTLNTELSDMYDLPSLKLLLTILRRSQ